jgi:hypothetical protein
LDKSLEIQPNDAVVVEKPTSCWINIKKHLQT